MRSVLFAAMVLFGGLLCTPQAQAQEYSVGAKYIDAYLSYAPRPDIPTALKTQNYSPYCIARFVIDPSGRAYVRLLSGSGVTQIDDIVYSTLRGWRFAPATLGGKPVEAIRTIRVNI